MNHDQVARQSRFLSSQAYVRQVIQTVVDHYGLTIRQLESFRRHRTISRGRAVAAFLLRRHTTLSYPEIGKSLGGFDHSSMICACRRIRVALKEDPGLVWDITQIEQALQPGEPPTGIEPAASPIPTERSAS